MRGLSFLGFWLLIVLTSLGQSDFSFLQYRHVGPIRGGAGHGRHWNSQ